MSTENLNSAEAREKLKDLVEDIRVAMMVTGLGKIPLNAIPMSTREIDDHGDIWFLSLRNSEHNNNIAESNQVQLLYSDPSEMEFVSVYGTAEIVTNKEILHDLYNEMADAWFEGPENPNLTAIKFHPVEAYYWNNKTNKYVTLYKLGIAALTGKHKDLGESGKLDL